MSMYSFKQQNRNNTEDLTLRICTLGCLCRSRTRPNMKAFVLAIVLLGLSAQAFAANQPEEKTELLENEARFLYYNGSSTAAAITLLGALILLAVIAYLIYVGGVLSTQGSSGYNRNDYQNSQYEAYDQNYAQYR
jgi:hypothetical protein